MVSLASPTVVVVGSGLAGMSAAIEAYRHGAHVHLFEKEPRGGGNSAKASSGMNAVNTYVQRQSNVSDSETQFYEDIERSGGGLSTPALLHHLVTHAQEAHAFLESFGLQLDKLSRCGGHTFPRTHRESPDPSGRPVSVGWDIVKTLNEYIESEANQPSSVSFGTIHRYFDSPVVRLMHTSGRVNGIVYKHPETLQETSFQSDAVILTTGGFSANQDMLSEVAPHVAGLPTTNGQFAQGDGLVLTRGLAEHVDVGEVQLHPTAFVGDAMSRALMLAPESLRAHGAVLVDGTGARFVDELDTRDRVVAAMQRAQGPFRLLVHATLHPDIPFYRSRGVFTNYTGPIPKDAPLYLANQPLLSALVTPAVHYCMGGVKINTHAQALASKASTTTSHEQQPVVHGLYAAGEVTGGLHGKNRLAGNSLLECVVFGRTAGQHAALTGTSQYPFIHPFFFSFFLFALLLAMAYTYYRTRFSHAFHRKAVVHNVFRVKKKTK